LTKNKEPALPLRDESIGIASFATLPRNRRVALFLQVRYEHGQMEALTKKARVHLKVCGRVQGVYFRASTVEQARRLGLSGWVMNCEDSSVEVVAEGEIEQLEKLAHWCHSGPPGAHVKEVRAQWGASKEEFQSFYIRR
jgi:acylphosphatase